MQIVSSTLKTTALAGILGLAALAASTTSASAHTYTRCDRDGDRCVRIHCDSDGDDCWRESVYNRESYYYGRGRWVCDSDGDDCHWRYHGNSWGVRGYSGGAGLYYNQGNSYGYGHRHHEEDEDDDE